jgi:putative peptide zinc metalloprotease protein
MLEPGVLRSAMYNVMLIASVSTVLFNINPLLRFDGYYMLADLIESPNLTQRANRYIAYLAQKYLLGHRRAEPVALARGERGWFVFYSVAAFVYRLFVAAAIIVFVAGQFFTIGLLLAVWAGFTMLVLPLGKAIWFVLYSPAIESTRRRAVRVSAGLAAGVLALLFVLPLPFMTRAEGVVWLPEQSHVRAGTDAFIGELRARTGATVRAGEVIAVATDPVLEAGRRKAAQRLAELQARYRAEQIEDIVAAQVTLEEMVAARRELARFEEKAAQLLIRSHVDGTLILPRGEDLVGRFVQQGELLGYVVGSVRPTIRTVVAQADVDLVRSRTESVSVRLASRVPDVYQTRLLREVPQASDELPSAALTQRGGGEIANSPYDDRPEVAYAKLFQFEAELPGELEPRHFGGRVYVRFNHGLAPLWQQWYRELKVLFLRLLDA